MKVRVAVLTDQLDDRRAPFWNALGSFTRDVELLSLSKPDVGTLETGSDRWIGDTRISRSTRRRPLFTLPQLVLFRPQLMVCENFGLSTHQAALFRAVSPRSRLLLCATDVPAKIGPRRRWILRHTDGVLVDDPAAAAAIDAWRFPRTRIFSSAQSQDLLTFLACHRSRSETEARRLIFAGDLTPGSGAADLLISVIAWADENPGNRIEIWWAGSGDLAGILDAQPLPPGVSQRFLGKVERSDLAAAFSQCGILVVPSLGEDRSAPVLEGLAAGLPVLGSRSNLYVGQSVRNDVNGWVYDPMQPEGLSKALAAAMTVPLTTLEHMRDRAQASVRPATTVGLAERFSSALASIMPDLARPTSSQSIQ